MTYGDAMLALAKGQGALLRLTKELLKEDKFDGLEAARWTEKHEKIYREIYEMAEDKLDPEEVEKCRKAAGDPE